jgi:hypothetical protein
VRTTVGRLLALVVAIGLAVGVILAKDLDVLSSVKWVAYLLFSLALIWFPEEVGSFTGYIGRGGDVDCETPPLLVSIAGWFFLVGLPILLWRLSR